MALIAGITDTLAATYSQLQHADPRWVADFDDIALLINPNHDQTGVGVAFLG